MADKTIEQYVENTRQRLPEDVDNFVGEHCIFIKQKKEGVRGTTVSPKDHKNRWVIVLFTPFERESDPPSVIAHEIAHAWLGHHGENTQEHEEQAEDQVKKWGFPGCGGEFYEDRWVIDDAEKGLHQGV